MPHHVRVGEVHQEEVVLVRAHAPGPAATVTSRRAHLGLQVVGLHVARAGDQHALLAGEDDLATAVEEEGDVGVLLGLGGAELASARSRPGPRGRCAAAARAGRPPGGRTSRRTGSCRRSGRAAAAAAVELLEVGECQRAGQLARAVGAEVEEDAPRRRRGSCRPARPPVDDHRGLDELVGRPSRRRRRGPPPPRPERAGPDPAHDGVVGLLHPVPALVAVHRVVAAADAWRCGRCRSRGGNARAPRGSRSALCGGVSRPSRKRVHEDAGQRRGSSPPAGAARQVLHATRARRRGRRSPSRCSALPSRFVLRPSRADRPGCARARPARRRG